jgi:tRNA G18 (ribose-2'-O)-methylase SpoU
VAQRERTTAARVESAADYRVQIAISDRVDSLNLAVVVGVALRAPRRTYGSSVSLSR